MDKATQSRISTVFITALLFAAALGYVIFFKNFTTRYDDAFMYIRYAGNLLAGKGIAWNPDGAQTYGVTSLLYLFLVAFFKSFLTLRPEILLMLLSGICAFLGWVSLMEACVISVNSAWLKRPLIMSTLLFLTIFIEPSFRYHFGTGMETMLSFFVNSLLIVLVLQFLRRPSIGLSLATALIAYLTYLTRPDNGLVMALFPFLSLLLLMYSDKKRQLLLCLMGSIFALLAVDITIKYFLFGHPLPLPFFAKKIGYYRGFAAYTENSSVVALAVFLRAALPFIVVLILTARTKHLKMLCAFLLPAGLTFACLLSFVSGFFDHGRFFYPFLAFFVVPAVICLDSYMTSCKEGAWVVRGIFMRAIAIGCLAIFLIYAPVINTKICQLFYPKGDQAALLSEFYRPSPKLPVIGWWETIGAMSHIAQQCPEGTVIAASEHGYLAATAPHVTVIDLVGLHDPRLARQGFSADYVLNLKPDFIWLPGYAYRFNIINRLFSSQRFLDEYEYYPGAFDYGLAVRRESAYHAKIIQLVRLEWNGLYGKRGVAWPYGITSS